MIYLYAAREEGGQKKFIDFQPDNLTCQSLEWLFSHLDQFVSQIDVSERYNLYYGMAQVREPRRKDAKGKKKGSWADAKWVKQEALAWDIDAISEADRSKVTQYQDILAQVLQVDPKRFTIVASGHGFHFLLMLEDPIESWHFFEENRIFYRATLDAIDAGIQAAGLSGSADPAIFDHARVMRLPLTQNRKREPWQDCRMLQLCLEKVGVDLKRLAGVPEIKPEEAADPDLFIDRRLDKEGILSECLVMRQVVEEPLTVKEPLGYAALSILGRLDKDRATAKEIYKTWASSTSLMTADPSRKIEQAISASGPRTCESFSGLSTKCSSCSWSGKITTPLQIKGENFIETALDGYWRSERRGDKIIKVPAFDDMLKSYSMQKHYFLKPETDTVWAHTGTHYIQAQEAELRNWSEVYTRPNLNRDQVGQFIFKLRSNHLMGEEAFEELRARCHGKLNMKNGVLDTRTGQLEKHSHEYGFKYVLPYDYDPGATCPNFDAFLFTILQGNQELIAAIWDMLGASLLTGYDEMDAAFWWLSGSGSNGKTTLLRVMGALVGEKNCLYLQPQNFGSKDRFALSQLEGKLLAITEEVNDKQLGDDMLGVLKNLTSGGTINVEGKGTPHYNMRNTAKFVFTSNKTVVLEDVTEGLQRRFIIIPLDVNFEEPQWEGKKDPQIFDKLKGELPGVLNRALVALSALRARGGKALKPAVSKSELDNMVLNSDSVERWCRDHLEVTNDPDEYILSQEAFTAYQGWMGEERQVSLSSFIARLRKKTHSALRAKPGQVRQGSERKRVIWGVRLLNSDAQAVC